MVWADASRKQRLQKPKVNHEVFRKWKSILLYLSSIQILSWRWLCVTWASPSWITHSLTVCSFQRENDPEMVPVFSKGKGWSRMHIAGKMELCYAAVQFECCTFPLGGLVILYRVAEKQRIWSIPVLWSLCDTLLQTLLWPESKQSVNMAASGKK